MTAMWRMLLLSAAVALLFVAFPGGYESQRTLELYVVASLVVLACLARFVGPHVPEPWALDSVILLVGVLCAVTAGQLPENEGQLLIGFGMMAVGVFTAFFRTARHALLLTGAILAMWLVAVSLDRTLSSPAIAIALVIIVLGVTLFVSQLVQRLHDLALHDGLTGVLNRRGLELLAEPVIAGARRAGLPVTIAIVDIDRFKLFNDTRGHIAGDGLLVAVADAWGDAVRDSDLLARFGGDEFVLVLVGASLAEAQVLDERATATFSSARPSGWGDSWTIGITSLDAEERLHEAIDRADAEMLERKQATHGVPPQRDAHVEPPAVTARSDPPTR
jgi:diguanylate cyclase (GGDEF)-like protein